MQRFTTGPKTPLNYIKAWSEIIFIHDLRDRENEHSANLILKLTSKIPNFTFWYPLTLNLKVIMQLWAIEQDAELNEMQSLPSMSFEEYCSYVLQTPTK